MENNNANTQPSTFGQDIVQAEQDFVKQFDPKSETYHQGDQRVVPVGGERIPESMPTMYDEAYIKKSQESENINYGPEYDKLVKLRAGFQDLKKTLNQICPPLEGVLRIKAKVPLDEDSDKQIATEMAKVDKPISEVKQFIETVKESSFAEKYVDGLTQICKDAYKDFKSKEEYTDYVFLVKKYTSLCFNEAATVLEQMKKIKKNYKPENAPSV